MNHLIYDQFTTERVDLLTVDNKIAYIISNDLYPNLRKSIKNFVPVNEVIVFNDEVLSSPAIQSVIQAYDGKKLFPFSRKEFYSSFLSSLPPSLADTVYHHLKITGRILPIGGGQHKAFIITPIKLKEEESLIAPHKVDPNQVCESITSALSLLSEYINDSSFYEEKIAQRDSYIESLYSHIETLQSQINSAYQTTWR